MINTLDNIIEIREEFKSLFEYSLDYLFVYDFEGRILEVNEIMLKALEYSKEEILKKTIFDFVIEEDMNDALTALNRLKKRGRVTRYNVFKIKKKNGGFIYLEVSGIPFKLKNNTPVVLGIGHDITLLKETEIELKNSEKKYRSLFDESPIGIMLFDMEGNLIDKNSTMVNGFPEFLEINLTGKNFREILSFFKNTDQLTEVFMERLRAVRKGQETKPFEFFIDTKEGRRIWVSWQSSLVKVDSETYIQVLLHNITERKETEKNLIDSEHKFHVLFNNSTSGIAYHKLVYDTNGTPIDYIITDVNPQYERILPLKREDVINKKSTEIYQVESAPYIDIYSRVATTQESTSFEAYFPPLDKYFKISVISPKKGEFITVFDDISESKKVVQSLKESEEKFRTIAEQSFMGITIIQDDIITYANQAILDIFGYTLDEIISWKPLEYLELFPPKEREFLLGKERKKQEEYDLSIHNYQVLFIKKNGEIGWLDLFSNPIKYKGRLGVMVSVIDITDKMKAEQKLKESEEKFRTITEQSYMGILIVEDWNLNFTYSNQKFADIVGYTREEIENWKIEDFFKMVHPDDVEDLIEFARKKYEQEVEVLKNYQFRVFKKTGEIIWLEVDSKTFPYGDGLADLVTVMDITERRNAEKELKESEEKFRIITEQSFLGIIIIQDNHIKYANEAIAKILEYSTEELVGMSIEYLGENIFHPEDLPLLRDRVRLRRRSGEASVPPYSAYRVFTKSGELRWIEDYTKVILYQGKNALLTSIMDITEKTEAEQRLRESEEKFRIITEQSFLGIIILQDNQIRYANEAISKMTEYSTEELVGMSMDDMRGTIIPNEDVDLLIKRFRLRQSGDTSIGPYITYRVITKSGSLKWVEHYSKIINIQGEVALVVSIMDITEKKEAEKLIIEENKKLLELDEMRKEMITRISHELKTPLTSIYGAIQILSESLRDQMNDNVLKFVDVIHRGSIRFKKLIENLLDISRMDSRKLELNTQQEDLSEIVNECVNEMVYLANNRDLKIELNLPNELLFELDKLRIEQAITNIISNAIKNTPMNGLISISLLDYKENIDIKIEDTGVGLTQNEKLKLFKKFGKIERYGMDLDVDIEGIGLGLFISKEIVELHGGKILVESEGRNRGTTFTIRLFKN